MPGLFIDLTNQSFGYLTVIKISHRSKYGKVYWDCICKCGFKTKVSTSDLKSNKSKSCGRVTSCQYAFENRSNSLKHHGLTSSKEFRSWQRMKIRCYNPNSSGYQNWGGKNIKVCDEWRDDFINFYNYLQTLPETLEQFKNRTNLQDGEISLDRIDYNKNYEPGNIRWVNPTIQAQNRSMVILNEDIVKFILWEYKVNKLHPPQIYDKLKNQINFTNKTSGIMNIRHVCFGKTWNNINIDKEIAEYKQFGTVNGIKI